MPLGGEQPSSSPATWHPPRPAGPGNRTFVTPQTYNSERIDTINGAILSDVVSIFIIIATAAAIGGPGPLSNVGQAAAALRPVAGEAAAQLFAVGLLGAALLAATVVPLSTAHAIAETAGVERSLSRKLREAPLFYGICTVQLVVGAAVASWWSAPRSHCCRATRSAW